MSVNVESGLSTSLAITENHTAVVASFVANGGSAPSVEPPHELGYGEDVGSAVGASSFVIVESAGISVVSFDTTGGTPVSLAASIGPNIRKEPFLELGASVVMEAEHFSHSEARSNLWKNWKLERIDSGYTGSGYMVVEGGSVGGLGGYAFGSRLVYNVDFLETGTYNVYVRRRSSVDSTTNSVFVGLDGDPAPSFDNGGNHGQWDWVDLGSVAVNESGVFPVDLVLREDGYQVDRVVLSKGGIPSGTGPEESPHLSDDRDGDGVPDGFEFRNYGHRTDGADEHSDLDGDGAGDAAELVAGTDPRDSDSVFKITEVARSGDEVTLEWTSVSGKMYTVFQSNDLSEGSWISVLENIPSSGASTNRKVIVSGDSAFFHVGISE